MGILRASPYRRRHPKMPKPYHNRTERSESESEQKKRKKKNMFQEREPSAHKQHFIDLFIGMAKQHTAREMVHAEPEVYAQNVTVA